MNTPTEIITSLLNTAIAVRAEADAPDMNIRIKERIISAAAGYVHAAQCILHGYPELHNSVIDIPEFVKGRKIIRETM